MFLVFHNLQFHFIRPYHQYIVLKVIHVRTYESKENNGKKHGPKRNTNLGSDWLRTVVLMNMLIKKNLLVKGGLSSRSKPACGLTLNPELRRTHAVTVNNPPRARAGLVMYNVYVLLYMYVFTVFTVFRMLHVHV